MKTKKRVFGLAMAAVLLVGATVLGTMAYLTDSDQVTNTFTVGNVSISMDEAKVDTDGVIVEGADRVQENSYKLMPGHTYVKDPTVVVSDDSEDCYIFVDISNGIADIEDANNTIAAQIEANGWTALEGHSGIYYKEASAGDQLVVFNSFTVSGSVDADTLAAYSESEITIVAYAVQMDGFESALDAYEVLFQ